MSCPSGKQTYKSRHAAKLALRRSQTGGQRHELWPYKCPECAKYHLTKTPDMERPKVLPGDRYIRHRDGKPPVVVVVQYHPPKANWADVLITVDSKTLLERVHLADLELLERLDDHTETAA